MINLNDHIENISDDFQSTFALASPTAYANMLQGDHEFEEVTKIIQKYYPTVEVSFTKTNQLGSDPYDIYLIYVEEKKC